MLKGKQTATVVMIGSPIKHYNGFKFWFLKSALGKQGFLTWDTVVRSGFNPEEICVNTVLTVDVDKNNKVTKVLELKAGQPVWSTSVTKSSTLLTIAMGHRGSGRIVTLHKSRGFGFIHFRKEFENLFFHEKDCINQVNFNSLRVGDEVKFKVIQGEKGPKAQVLEVVAKP